MKRQLVDIKMFGQHKTVELTGRAIGDAFEVFQDERTIWIEKEYVVQEHRNRIPKSGTFKEEADKGYFFIPEHLFKPDIDQYAKTVANQVWRQLPAFDRFLLSQTITEITDQDDSSGQFLVFRLATKIKLDQSSVHNPASFLQDVPQRIILAEVRQLKQDRPWAAHVDGACRFLVAEEFAHIIQRHPQMLALLYAHLNGDQEEGYEALHLAHFEEWARDQAALQVWNWGFTEEFEDYLKLKSGARQPLWYRAINPQRSVERKLRSWEAKKSPDKSGT